MSSTVPAFFLLFSLMALGFNPTATFRDRYAVFQMASHHGLPFFMDVQLVT